MCASKVPPQCSPLSSLESVLQWKPDEEFCSWSCAAVKLSERCVLPANRPKTLVCHDYKGGYLEDRFIQGVDSADVYRFFHWLYVDVFVYFSHHLVTIPPPCWIDVAHTHGCTVLGTFITEWDEGASICKSFLKDEVSYKALADQLVLLAITVGFDGWLINIENKIDENDVCNLVAFVDYLTRTMHEKQLHSAVIWYDSVTVDGNLNWQNELNCLNQIFFDASDGIFLNYTWNSGNLQSSLLLGEKLFRQYDIYVGIDVFGRGMFGGGGFETYKAVEMARHFDLSLAIFAPAWVYECLDKKDFTRNEYKFWSKFLDWLPTHAFPTLPLYTSFCQGQGKKYYQYGKVVHAAPWTNLSLQNAQPLCDKATEVVFSQMQCFQDDAFHGGSCLRFRGELKPPENHVSFHLFDFTYPLLLVEGNIFLLYTYKRIRLPENVKFFIDFKVRVDDEETEYLTYRLCNDRINLLKLAEYFPEELGLDSLIAIKPMTDYSHLPSPLRETIKMQEAHSEETGWVTRCYTIDDAWSFHAYQLSVGFVSLQSECQYDVLMGQLLVTGLTSISLSTPVPEVRSHQLVTWEDNITSLSCLLKWTSPLQNIMYFNTFYAVVKRGQDALPDENFKLIGARRAKAIANASTSFLVCNLELDTTQVSDVFIKVQSIDNNGWAAPLELLPVARIQIDDE